MRIIKNGCVPPSEYIVECNRCGCVFDFTLSDIEVKESSQVDYIPDYGPFELTTYTMSCPYCKTQMLSVRGGNKLSFLDRFMWAFAVDKKGWNERR